MDRIEVPKYEGENHCGFHEASHSFLFYGFLQRRLSSISIVLVDKEAIFRVKHLTEIVLVIIQGVQIPLAWCLVSSPFFECVLRVGHILNSIPYFPYSNRELLLLWRTTARM